MGSRNFVRPVGFVNPAGGSRRAVPARGDMILLAVVAVLAIFGIIMIDSASPYYLATYTTDPPMSMVYRQLAFILGGAVVIAALGFFDYRRWIKLAVPMILLVIAALFMVIITNNLSSGPIRAFFNGSVRPAEFAKVGIIIYLSVWLVAKRDILHDFNLGLIPLFSILGIVGGLIVIQDLSAGLTILLLGALLFFLIGGDIRQFAVFMIGALLVGALVIMISSRTSNRISTYLAGLQDASQYQYQVKRSLEALIRGGTFGLGLGKSFTKVTGLPVPPMDSIFAVLVEELGLVGSLMLMLLYGFLMWRGIRIAQKSPDLLGSVMAGGLTFWIMIEAAMNMAYIVGLFPVTGNNLPFISYGGSSFISTCAAIGILFSISRHAGSPMKDHIAKRSFNSETVDLRRRDRRRRVSRASRP